MCWSGHWIINKTEVKMNFTELARKSMKSVKGNNTEYGLMKSDLGTKESQDRAAEIATGLRFKKGDK